MAVDVGGYSLFFTLGCKLLRVERAALAMRNSKVNKENGSPSEEIK